MIEKLDADRQREIIEDFMHKVMQESPDCYYSPTADIARLIHTKIQEELKTILLTDQKLVKALTVRDIQIILSLK